MIFVIAEAGLNFSGSVDKALKMVDVAKRAGANAVKFQAFLPSFDPSLARFTLSLDEWNRVFGHALESKITFMCTPFDRWAFDMLRDMGITHWKIPSGELMNDAYLRAIPEQARSYYLSTGMADIPAIQHALNILPSPIEKNICLMYCVSGYPAPSDQLNLHTILQWNLFEFPQYDIGFSDHTTTREKGWAAIAIAMGAAVIEKHFTLEKGVPDEIVSLYGEKELRTYIHMIRKTERAMGDGIKRVQPCEIPTFSAKNRFK